MIHPLSPVSVISAAAATVAVLFVAVGSPGCSSDPAPPVAAGCRVALSVSPEAGADCPSKGCRATVANTAGGATTYAVCTQLCTVGGSAVCADDELCFSQGTAKDGVCALRCAAAQCKAPLTCRSGDVCY